MDLNEMLEANEAEAELRLGSALRDIIAKAARIEADMKDLQRRAQKWIDGEPSMINELGELQSTGADLDRLCALIGARRETFTRARAMSDEAGVAWSGRGHWVK